MATFNSYQITRNSQTQPYVNSLSEIGYFGNPSVQNTADPYYWISVPITLSTNNGLATVSGTSGLNITNPGIYRLTVSLNFINTPASGNQITFFICFGTNQLTNTTLLSGTLGGTPGYGNNYTYSVNNPTYPGILSWIVNAFSPDTVTIGIKENTSASIFNLNPSRFGTGNNATSGTPLLYNFYASTSGSSTAPAICSSELIITINAATTIYLNVSTDKGKFTIDRSYFTLQLISSTYV
jgi:hypothetical protein